MDRELNDTISDQLQPTRRKIVLALKQHGGLTAAELAEMLGITSMGVRRHLTTLERDKLVRYELVQRGKGRPSYVYRLSPQAENLFPKNYAQLAIELLGYLANEEGEDTVIRLFERRAERRIRNAQSQLSDRVLADRVATLAKLLSNEGYLAEYEQEDERTFWLREHNCAVHDVANEFTAACASELTFLQAVLPDAIITREHHMMGGELMCSYRIEASPAGPGANGTGPSA